MTGVGAVGGSGAVPVVGFDLDLTLVDSAERISTCLVAALAAHGVRVDPAEVRATIGVPLEATLDLVAPGTDAAWRAAVTADYRARHDAPDAPAVLPLPGAAAALAAVRDAGGRTAVVSAKPGPAAQRVLVSAGLSELVDVVVGDRFAAAKGAALVDLGTTAYVGDHPGDVVAARTAGVEGVSVATGPHDTASLTAAGATTVLADLRGFPTWLAGHVRRLAEARGGERR